MTAKARVLVAKVKVAAPSGKVIVPKSEVMVAKVKIMTAKTRVLVAKVKVAAPSIVGMAASLPPQGKAETKFNSNMKRQLRNRHMYERGAAAIPGTCMRNRIAESPQFVESQAKLSTVLAGSEGDCCESHAPKGRLAHS